MNTQQIYETWRSNPTGKIPKGDFCEHCARYNTRNSTVEIIVENEKGEVLLTKRKKDPQSGWWCLPSGYMNWDETVAEAAARELKEETGLTATSLRFLSLFDSPQRDLDGRQNIGHCFVATASGETKMQEDEVTEIGWFNKETLPENIGFDHRDMIEAYWNTAAQKGDE